MKPWLLIDVDEVLNVWPGPTRPDGEWQVHSVANEFDQVFTLHLNPVHGDWLNGLADVFDLAWCTTWWEVANERISPRLGLPTDLPCVPLPDQRYADVPVTIAWKTPHVHHWARGRALAWIDDDITPRDQDVLMTPTRDGPAVSNALAIPIPLGVGLLWEHIERLRHWAEAL